MPNRYGHTVVPVLVDTGGKTEHEGSALLVEGPDKSFWLVSAVHVIAQPTGHFPSVPWSRSRTLRILGTVYSTCKPTPEEAKSDEIDVAAIRLDPWIVDELRGSGAAFLSFSRLERSHDISNCQCALTGYPDGSVEWDENSVLSKVEALQIHVDLHPNEKVSIRGFEPNLHVIAKYGHTLSDGTRKKFPKPRGMSGGVVWILRDDGPKAAGIITTCISQNTHKRALVCTRMSGIAAVIEDPSRARTIKLSQRSESERRQ